MTEFNERIEGEIKTHEKEMMRKAVIKKYGDKDLIDRIHYVMSTYEKYHWTGEEVFEKLTEIGLNGADSVTDVKNEFSNPSFRFPSKVVWS